MPPRRSDSLASDAVRHTRESTTDSTMAEPQEPPIWVDELVARNEELLVRDGVRESA